MALKSACRINLLPCAALRIPLRCLNRTSALQAPILPFLYPQREIGIRSKSRVAPQIEEDVKPKEQPENIKRKTRTSVTKSSLRRVAVEAQRSRAGKSAKDGSQERQSSTNKVFTVQICTTLELIREDRHGDMCCRAVRHHTDRQDTEGIWPRP